MVATLNCNVDVDVKNQAKAVYANWGIDLTTAINVFLRKSIECGGFPFEVRPKTPNAENIAAILEAKALAKDPNAKTFHSIQDLLADWESLRAHPFGFKSSIIYFLLRHAPRLILPVRGVFLLGKKTRAWIRARRAH